MINKFNIKEVRDFWDKVADIYEEENKKVGYVHYHRYEKAIEYGNFRSGQKVLNIWSRMGGFIPYIRKIPQIELMNYSSFKSILHIPPIILPLGSERGERLSEKCMMRFFGRTPLVNFGVRHFYICKKSNYFNNCLNMAQ